MKLPFFPRRQEIHDKWWNRLSQVLILVVTLLGFLFGLLIASEGEDASIVLFLPLILYAIGVGLYHTILYVGFGHANSGAKHTSVPKAIHKNVDSKSRKLDKIAIHMKWCNALFLAAILLLIVGGITESDGIIGVGGFAILGVVYCMIAIEIMVWKSAWKYAAIISLLLGGLIGIIAFFYAYGEAKKQVKTAGYTVGLLGPREISFFGDKQRMSQAPTTMKQKTTSVKETKKSTVAHKKQKTAWNQWFMKIDSLEAAKSAVAQGYVAAYIIAGITAVVALIALVSEESIAGIDEWAMVDVLLMAAAGIGMQFYSRTAAVGALVLFTLGKVVMFSEGQFSGTGVVISVIFFLALLNGVRGAMAYHQYQNAHATTS